MTLDQLVAAAEMPFDATGSGTQIISDTVLTLKVQPYPPRASQPATVTLAVVSPDGSAGTNAVPVLNLKDVNGSNARELSLQPQAGGVYSTHGILFPAAGIWRIRVDVNVGDDVPATMLATIAAR
ncbi:MAG TPA: hypothetical protein VGK87_12400 [Anaerolineae bacterium]